MSQNIRNTDHEIRMAWERYVNDPVIRELLKRKSELVAHSIPIRYIYNKEMDLMDSVYSKEVQSLLEHIDKELDDYKQREYGEYLDDGGADAIAGRSPQ